jgi:hypothetical protein
VEGGEGEEAGGEGEQREAGGEGAHRWRVSRVKKGRMAKVYTYEFVYNS